MIKLDQRYARQDFIDFLQDTFLQDYVRDVRPVGTQGLNAIKKATSLGRSNFLDLQIFEFEYTGSVNKRVTLTKEAFQLMKQSVSFNALAIFYGQDSDDWRLSFLTANPERTEKGKTTLAYSNPRRYSFFLGPNAKINTPYRFLIKDGQIKDHDDLLSRFNVEIVTKEFFENYKKLFDRLLGYLKKDHAFQAFANRNGLDTANFSKKLLGQIVFLYFLQRKGWLGAHKGDSISAGDKNFLRSLFNRSREKKENFYNQYLEKLFYGALNKPPEKAGSYYRSYFDCQIPFLNGGLFEPPQNYDWEGEFLLLPDKLFSKDPKNPSHGDGILDIFDLYNFTVDESDYLDKEVSVDPEMLGKVFENLIEENLRKGKGTYYTPREIVNYMCEESLVNYVSRETGLTPDDVKNKYFPAYNVLGDEKFEARDVSVSEQIIGSLENIRIVDPACGSGAFLVGMLQQITHLHYELETRSKLLGRREKVSSEYEIKKQTIQNCIYGVDIDPGAVEIAKLRLWLSLVVDYELEDIEPLPNLDYKIMQGNSLLEELVLGDTTIKLYDRQAIEKALGSKRMKNLFEEEPQMAMFDDIKKEQALKNMRALQLQYFSQSNANEKKRIKSQIEKIEHDLIEASVKDEVDKLSAQRLNIKTIPSIGLLPEDAKRLIDITSKESQIMAVLDELEKTGTKPFFLWHLHFSDVFEQTGGFDVVIGNPPYGLINKKQNKHTSIMMSNEEFRFLKKMYPEATGGMINIFRFFIVQSVSLLRDRGIFSEIFPLSFTGDQSMSHLRKSILDNNRIVGIEAFPERDNVNKRVFRSVKMSVCIMLLIKTGEEKSFFIRKNNDRFVDITNEKISLSLDDIKLFDPENLSIPIINSHDCVLLRNIYKKSGRFGDFSRCFDGEVHLTKYKHCITDNDKDEVLLKGAIIDRYQIREKMSQGKIQFLNKTKFLAGNSGEKAQHHKNARIIMQRITGVNENTRIKATIISSGVFCANSIGYLVLKPDSFNEKFVLSVLNSKISNYIFKLFSTNSNVNGYEIENLPFPNFSSEQDQQMLIELVSKILAITVLEGFSRDINTQTQVKEYEKQIDQIVYRLYGLTEAEIKIVEGTDN